MPENFPESANRRSIEIMVMVLLQVVKWTTNTIGKTIEKEYVLFLQTAEEWVPEIDQNILEGIIEKETVIEKEITTEGTHE